MPVSYTSADSRENYIIPAPLVSISKAYDTTGDGNIIGTRYTITLTGKLIAHAGSPNSLGVFSDDQSTGSDDIRETIDSEAWYRSIQKKQRAMSNLFSRVNEGGRLRLIPPEDESIEGLSVFPRIVSVDFPQQAPGGPNVCDYTVVLEADRLVGYAGDFDGHQINANFSSLVSSAEETWDIQENEGQSQFSIVGAVGATPTPFIATVQKTYTLTHSIKATGKRMFNEATGNAGDLAVDNVQAGMTSDGVVDGEAWQQAKSYVLNLISNTAPGTRIGGYQTEAGFIGVDGINLSNNYTGYDYKRIQQIDKTGGTFGVTETWLLADGVTAAAQGAAVLESIEVEASDSMDSGFITVNVNGSIEGLSLTGLENVRSRPEEVLMPTNKYAQALTRLNTIGPVMYIIAQNTAGVGGLRTLNPIHRNKSITFDKKNGIINYQFTFDNRATTCIPGALSETINVVDTHPSHVVSATPVIGRRLGPVFQDINTQTAWKRTLSIDVQVSGVIHGCAWGAAMGRRPSMVLTPYNQQAALRTIIDVLSPVGKNGASSVFASNGPRETWDAIAGKYTYEIEWTYQLKESNGASFGESYLGTTTFQYPRVVTNTTPGIAW